MLPPTLADRQIFQAEPSLIDLVSASLGVCLTPEQMRGMGAEGVVLHSGRVTLLRYAEGSDDLDAVRLDEQVYTRDEIANLPDFRTLLERAGRGGDRLVFMLDRESRLMFMVNVLPAAAPS